MALVFPHMRIQVGDRFCIVKPEPMGMLNTCEDDIIEITRHTYGSSWLGVVEDKDIQYVVSAKWIRDGYLDRVN